jgi:hypothetical protein
MDFESVCFDYSFREIQPEMRGERLKRMTRKG